MSSPQPSKEFILCIIDWRLISKSFLWHKSALMRFSMWERRHDSEPRKQAFSGNAFPGSTSAVLTPRLGGVSVALSPSLSRPQHPPSLLLNHSDPAHLEPMCSSILSSTVVISNQPICVSLSPHQRSSSSQPGQGGESICLSWKETKMLLCSSRALWVVFVLHTSFTFYIYCIYTVYSHAFTPNRHPKHWVNKRSATKIVN